MGRLEISYRNLATAVIGLLNLVGNIIGSLHSHKALSDTELSNILKSYVEIAGVPETMGKPTKEERVKINYYLGKVHRGDILSPHEVIDYNNLVAKLAKEKKDDPSVWPLVALGAFLLGLLSASKKQ